MTIQFGVHVGTYFYYVNQTKSEVFQIDPAGFDIKQYAIGTNFGSRAFSFLLLDNVEYYTGIADHKLVGSWVGDHVYITGDECLENFEQLVGSYTDIAADILDMMSVIAPGDFYGCGGRQWLINFATTPDQMPELIRRRLLKHYRQSNSQFPFADLQLIVDALRPTNN